MEAVVLKEYTKIIKRRAVLSNINFSLNEGGIYGFYGHNGSGKSMLLRAIAGLIHSTKGEVSVFGEKIGEDTSFPKNIGLIIESVGFWSYNNGFENLKVLASINHKISDFEIRDAIERVGLDPADKRTYGKYSLGMKQRLGIAQAIMEKPRLILLDEPTNALDDEGIRCLREIIGQEHGRGATILLASHNADDLALCSRLFKMSDGTLTETEGGTQNE